MYSFLKKALGMSVVSVMLLKGNKRVEGEARELQAELEKSQGIIQQLEDKYPTRMPDKVRKQFDDATFEVEQIEKKLAYLEELQQPTWRTKLKELGKPAWFLLGVCIMLMSAVIIISLLFTQVDRYQNSDCGWLCGFVITSPHSLLNPLDMALTYTSKVSNNYILF